MPIPVKSKKTASKPNVKKAAARRTENGIRLRKLSKRRGKKVEKKTIQGEKLPSAWTVFVRSIQHLYRHKKLFLGISLVYGLLYIMFVKGVSSSFELSNLRETLGDTFGTDIGGIGTGIALYSLLLGSAGSTDSSVGGAYQTVILAVVSLAIIYALRLTYAKESTLKVKDAFYKGMYPLVPFIIVSLIVILQLLPALIVGSLYATVQSNGIVIGALQQGIAFIIFIAGLYWSAYMLSSSLLAFYIVTLADAKPRAALKSARELVRFRRMAIVRKVLFLPIILLLFSAVVLIPLIIILPVAAEILFIIFTILVLSVIHSYLYSLYRSLL